MYRWIAPIVLLASCVVMLGCSMCCGPTDFDYPTIGGKHQRLDPTRGRVGSRLSDPNVIIGPSADSNLEIPEFATPDTSDLTDDDDEFDDDESLRELEERLENLDPDREGLEPVEGFEENPGGFEENPGGLDEGEDAFDTGVPASNGSGTKSARYQRNRPVQRNPNSFWR